MELTVGADPEFFVRTKTTKQYRAALFAPGTKKEPHKLDGGAVQRDGLAIEFNIDPAKTSEEFAGNIKKVMDQCLKLIPPDLEPAFEPSVFFDNDYYDSLPTKIKELGCDREYDASDRGRMKNIPEQYHDKSKGYLRTGAGHLHLGWTTRADIDSRSHIYDCCQLVKRLDRYFGLYKSYWDSDSYRSYMYGGHGSFRPKPYGLEYRVPSNAYLNHPELWPWLFESVKWVFNNAVTDPSRFSKAGYSNRAYNIHSSSWKKTHTTLDAQQELRTCIQEYFGDSTAPLFPSSSLLKKRLPGLME